MKIIVGLACVDLGEHFGDGHKAGIISSSENASAGSPKRRLAQRQKGNVPGPALYLCGDDVKLKPCRPPHKPVFASGLLSMIHTQTMNHLAILIP